MSQLKRWCFTSMSWTPSFKGFFSSCTRQPSCHGCWAHGEEARWQGQGGRCRWRQYSDPAPSATRKRLGEAAPGTDASLPHPPQSPGRQAPPPTSLFAGSSQSWERLKAKQQRTLEGEGGGCQTLARLSPHPHPPIPPPHPGLGLQEPRVSSPQLTLDLDPAGAAQEGPGLVPLLHRGQAGAEHLQPQVQHLLARGREGTCSEARAPDLSPPLLRLRLRHHLPQPCWSLSL